MFSYGLTSIGQAAKTYICQLCVDTGCYLEDLPKVIADKWEPRESVVNLFNNNHLFAQRVFLYNTNNLQANIWFQVTNTTNPY